MSQFMHCTETLTALTANIRLHAFATSKWMGFKITISAKFLLTNVTCKPKTFTMRFQQMYLELAEPSETVWTVSTWVRLCTSVNTNMTFQYSVCLKQLPTVRTVIWSSVAVYTTFMLLQVAGVYETFVTQWTLVWFVSCVDSHVTVEMSRMTKWLVTQVTFERFLSCVDSHHVTVEIHRLTKRFVTHVTLVWFLSIVNSAVLDKVSSRCKSFATNSTFKWFLPWMTSSVSCQVWTTPTTTATFCALVFTSMNIHMLTQGIRIWKAFITLSTWIPVFSSVSFSVNF